MKIEIILLGVIGFVFLIDFILNSRKKNSNDDVPDQIETKNKVQEKQMTDDFYEWISKYISNPKSILIILVFNFLLFVMAISLGCPSLSCPIDTWWGDDYFYITGYELTFVHLLILNIPLYLLIILSKENKSFNQILTYILNRKKNVSLFILSIPIIKIFIHYFIYPIMTRDVLVRGSSVLDGFRPTQYGQYYRKSLGEHIDVVFTDEVLLFIPAIVLVSFIAWFFNDKIKAR